MRIDAHQHFWRYAPGRQPWIDEAMAPLKRDFLPGDLEPVLRNAGVDGSVAVQAEATLEETQWLLALAEEHAFIRGVVGWVDLCAPDVDEQLRSVAHPNLKGIRHMVQSEPDDRFLVRPDFMRGIAALAAHDVAYELLVYPRQLAAASELARAFPEQRFVLDHLGKPQIRDGEIDGWARGIAALSRNRNVSAKLSGLVTEAHWQGWSADEFSPYIDVAMDWFGPERLMMGSDWPVCTLAGPYHDVTSIVADYVQRLPEMYQDRILGSTAAKVYKL